MTLLDVDAKTAFERMQEALDKIRAGESLAEPPKPRFGDYAVSLLERKIATGEIGSAKTRQQWGLVLEKHRNTQLSPV